MTQQMKSIQQHAQFIASELGGGVSVSDIIASSVPAIIVSLVDAQILRSTPLADQLFGYIEGGLIGKCLHDLVPERLRDVHRQHFEKFSTDPQSRPMGTAPMRLVGLHKSGREFEVEIGLHPRSIAGVDCVVATILKRKGMDVRGNGFLATPVLVWLVIGVAIISGWVVAGFQGSAFQAAISAEQGRGEALKRKVYRQSTALDSLEKIGREGIAERNDERFFGAIAGMMTWIDATEDSDAIERMRGMLHDWKGTDE